MYPPYRPCEKYPQQQTGGAPPAPYFHIGVYSSRIDYTLPIDRGKSTRSTRRVGRPPRQTTKGDWLFELTPVYVIAFLDFVLEDRDSDQPVARIRLMHEQTGEVFYQKLSIICTGLPKFNYSVEELASRLDKWLFLFRKLETLQTIPALFKEPDFMKFLEDAEPARLSDIERLQYEHRLKVYRDKRLMEYSRKVEMEQALAKSKTGGIARGEAIGRAKGKAEGKAEGMALGEAKGKAGGHVKKPFRQQP